MLMFIFQLLFVLCESEGATSLRVQADLVAQLRERRCSCQNLSMKYFTEQYIEMLQSEIRTWDYKKSTEGQHQIWIDM